MTFAFNHKSYTEELYSFDYSFLAQLHFYSLAILKGYNVQNRTPVYEFGDLMNWQRTMQDINNCLNEVAVIYLQKFQQAV